jgi:proteasome component ECM29
VVTACNPEGSASSSLNPTTRQATLSDATGFIIPFLLDKGLLAPSAEGKGFSIGLLLRIVKTTKSSLQAHLIQLIAVLVEAMSAMEPQTLQYMQFHTERLQISNEELESTRLKLSQQSPLQDALDLCLESLQAPECADMIADVVLNLSAQTKSGVGLATRTAAVRSLVFIINSDAHEAMGQAISQRCFRSLISSVVPNPPPSPSLKKELVAALGMLAKISTCEFLTEMVTSLVAIYRKSGTDNIDLVITIAECIHQIISKAGDMLQEETAMWHDLICCSFVGTFEEV